MFLGLTTLGVSQVSKATKIVQTAGSTTGKAKRTKPRPRHVLFCEAMRIVLQRETALITQTEATQQAEQTERMLVAKRTTLRDKLMGLIGSKHPKADAYLGLVVHIAEWLTERGYREVHSPMVAYGYTPYHSLAHANLSGDSVTILEDKEVWIIRKIAEDRERTLYRAGLPDDALHDKDDFEAMLIRTAANRKRARQGKANSLYAKGLIPHPTLAALDRYKVQQDRKRGRKREETRRILTDSFLWQYLKPIPKIQRGDRWIADPAYMEAMVERWANLYVGPAQGIPYEVLQYLAVVMLKASRGMQARTRSRIRKGGEVFNDPKRGDNKPTITGYYGKQGEYGKHSTTYSVAKTGFELSYGMALHDAEVLFQLACEYILLSDPPQGVAWRDMTGWRDSYIVPNESGGHDTVLHRPFGAINWALWTYGRFLAGVDSQGQHPRGGFIYRAYKAYDPNLGYVVSKVRKLTVNELGPIDQSRIYTKPSENPVAKAIMREELNKIHAMATTLGITMQQAEQRFYGRLRDPHNYQPTGTGIVKRGRPGVGRDAPRVELSRKQQNRARAELREKLIKAMPEIAKRYAIKPKGPQLPLTKAEQRERIIKLFGYVVFVD